MNWRKLREKSEKRILVTFFSHFSVFFDLSSISLPFFHRKTGRVHGGSMGSLTCTPRHPLPPTCCHHTRGHGAPQESNPTLCRLGCHKASHNRVTSAHEEGWEESSEGWAPRFWSVMALRRLLHGYRVPEAHANVRCHISRHAAERQQCGGAATSPHCQISSTIVWIAEP